MNWIDTFVRGHVYWCIVGLWVLNAMVLRMPPPDATSGKFYNWFFGVAHSLSGAIPRVASNFLPAGSWLFKLLAGGNGLTNGDSPAPQAQSGARG